VDRCLETAFEEASPDQERQVGITAVIKAERTGELGLASGALRLASSSFNFSVQTRTSSPTGDEKSSLAVDATPLRLLRE
jgi:hypothetical protein